MKNSAPNIWEAQENLIRFYKLTSIGLGGVSILLLIGNLIFAFRDPVVVVKEGGVQEYAIGKREKVEIGKGDIEVFSKKFLRALYVWSVFDANAIGKNIAPFVEDGLLSRAVDHLKERYGKEFKDKKLSEEIAFVSVEVKDDNVLCRFDRLLKIEGISLVIPTEMTLALMKGPETIPNPVGIYVSGITEHEDGK